MKTRQGGTDGDKIRCPVGGGAFNAREHRPSLRRWDPTTISQVGWKYSLSSFWSFDALLVSSREAHSRSRDSPYHPSYRESPDSLGICLELSLIDPFPSIHKSHAPHIHSKCHPRLSHANALVDCGKWVLSVAIVSLLFDFLVIVSLSLCVGSVYIKSLLFPAIRFSLSRLVLRSSSQLDCLQRILRLLS